MQDIIKYALTFWSVFNLFVGYKLALKHVYVNADTHSKKLLIVSLNKILGYLYVFSGLLFLTLLWS